MKSPLLIANIVLFSQSENRGAGLVAGSQKKEAGQKKVPRLSQRE
jgi:hypothetical protein